MLVPFALGLVVGALLGAGGMALLARRGREALVRSVLARITPVLERRAVALGIASRAQPAVDVGRDGELELRGADELLRVMHLADAIESHEHTQLGYVDTIKVPRDEVDARMAEHSSTRARR